ncbi:MAG: discoidin domain-containing protein [Kofleriaceae bacterium]
MSLAVIHSGCEHDDEEEFDHLEELDPQPIVEMGCVELVPTAVSVSGTDSSGNIGDNAIDGSLATRWSGPLPGAYIELDLGGQRTVCNVSIAWYRATERSNTFQIQTSLTGTTFTTVFSGSSSRTTADLQSYDIANTQARYVRVVVTGNSQNVNWASITELAAYGGAPTTPPPTGVDPFGVKKLFPTKPGGEEWYVNMNDARSSPRFKNLPTMTKQPDGSWRVSANQVRMEAWSPENKKWLNVEITSYAKVTSGGGLLQMYSRGGHHSSNRPCEGSAIKSRMYIDGKMGWVKEINHPAYTFNRGVVSADGGRSHMNKWIGHKAVIYNFTENGKTYVRMQNYIDTDVTDANGNLVPKNNWKLASTVEDRGGWSTSGDDYESSCGWPRDAILSKPGGTSTANLAAWRSDGTTWQWKYLSVREIEPPSE